MKKLIAKQIDLKIISLITILIICNFCCFQIVYAHNNFDEQILKELKDNNILIGNEEGINLDSNVTRNEMIVLLIRMLGAEDKIKNYSDERVPFKDTKSWVINYIKYAYLNGLTKGVNKSEFGGEKLVTLEEAETFLLRALSYTSENDFEYSKVRNFAMKNDIEKNARNIYDNKIITRRDLNILVYNTLNTKLKNRRITLAEKLNLDINIACDENNEEKELQKEEVKEENKNQIKNEVVSKEETENNKYENEKRIVGYLPTWSGTYYKKVDYSKLTHVNIAFANPDENGNLSSYLDNEMHEIVELAHKKDTQVLVSLGGAGYGDIYLNLISSKEKIKKFTKKIVDYVEKYKLDGIDLDIEGDVNKKFWNNYELFVKILKEECDNKDLLLTTAVGKWYAQNITDETFRYFDFVSVMAYDNDLDKSNHSTYEFANNCMNYFTSRGIEEEKLVLGVPFYGYNYKANGKMNWNGAKTYAQIISKNYDAKLKDNFGGYGYNGVNTITKKCNLSKLYGGIMIWSINQDASGASSLLALINENLKRE